MEQIPKKGGGQEVCLTVEGKTLPRNLEGTDTRKTRFLASSLTFFLFFSSLLASLSPYHVTLGLF